MTLAKGDLLGKLNKETGEPISTDAEMYIHWEVNGLTYSFGVATDLPAPIDNGLKELGIQIEGAGEMDVFQVVLLRKVR